jgi:hypothetical protein
MLPTVFARSPSVAPAPGGRVSNRPSRDECAAARPPRDRAGTVGARAHPRNAPRASMASVGLGHATRRVGTRDHAEEDVRASAWPPAEAPAEARVTASTGSSINGLSGEHAQKGASRSGWGCRHATGLRPAPPRPDGVAPRLRLRRGRRRDLDRYGRSRPHGASRPTGPGDGGRVSRPPRRPGIRVSCGLARVAAEPTL